MFWANRMHAALYTDLDGQEVVAHGRQAVAIVLATVVVQQLVPKQRLDALERTAVPASTASVWLSCLCAASSLHRCLCWPGRCFATAQGHCKLYGFLRLYQCC